MSNYNLAVQIGITLKRKWVHPNCKELIGATEMTPEIKKYLSSSRWQKTEYHALNKMIGNAKDTAFKAVNLYYA